MAPRDMEPLKIKFHETQQAERRTWNVESKTRTPPPLPGNSAFLFILHSALRILLLALLCVGAFGVTFALVSWNRRPATAPSDGPSGTVWIRGRVESGFPVPLIARAVHCPEGGVPLP
jgi:hypothetical protein